VVDKQPIPVTVDRDLEELIPGFLARRRDDVRKLREALDAHDVESVRVTGHSMKGTGGGYGFDGLSEIGASIESAAKGGDLDAARGGLERLVDYLERVEIHFE
jgi:HPt (histidine-containing phosphotransfer) domain-containing protein